MLQNWLAVKELITGGKVAMLTQDSDEEASGQTDLPAQVPAPPPGCCRVQGKSNDGDCLVEGRMVLSMAELVLKLVPRNEERFL